MINEATGRIVESVLRMQGFYKDRWNDISAYRGGYGQPIVLLHGILSRGPTTWGRVATSFARRGHAIMPDLPGFGASQLALAPHAVTVRSIARALLETLPSWTGGKRCLLVGVSLGGWIAARMALENPAAFDHVVLVGSAGYWTDPDEGRALGPVVMPQDPDGIRRLFSRVMGRPVPVADWAARDMVRTYRRDYSAVETLIAAGEDDQLTTAELSGFMPRAALVWGERDEMIAPKEGRAMASLIPGATLDILPNAAHVPMVETPGAFIDAVFRAVRAKR